MLIECTYGPVTTEVMGSQYTFSPDEWGRCVAEVWVPRHIDSFLSVVHYREVPKEPVALTLTSIEPVEAVLGSEDFTLICTGEGFLDGTTIVFADVAEPTTRISDTQVSTIVKPSLGWGAVPVPVLLRLGAEETAALSFTFTEPVGDLEGAGTKSGDDLEEDDVPVTEISGIGASMATKLKGVGITTANQIAALTEDEANALDEQLGLGGRIARDDWVEQAKKLTA